MGKSESQMDIVEKSTKSGKKSWSFVAIGLAVLLLLMTCAVVALVILYASSRGKEPVNNSPLPSANNIQVFSFSSSKTKIQGDSEVTSVRDLAISALFRAHAQRGLCWLIFHF